MEQKQTKEDSDEKFYQELDEKKSHQSCCTCQSLIVLFVILLLLVSGGIFYFYYQISRGGIKLAAPKLGISLNDIQEKFNKISLDSNNEFKSEITSEELSTLMSGGINVENLVLNDIYTAITTKNILIYGNLIKPLNSKVTITTSPEVKNGKIYFIVKEINAGNIKLPQILTNKFEPSINDFANQKFNLIYSKYNVTKIELKENKLIIYGKLKGF